MPANDYKMTDADALEFLKRHRDIIKKEAEASPLINYDLEAFDVAIYTLETHKLTNRRHKITDHEFVEKVQKIADEYIEADEGCDSRYMDRIVDLLSDYNERR